jgi:hypothetical protein
VSVVVSVIGQFLHPPVGIMRLERVTDTHQNKQVYTRPRGPVVVDAFGIRVGVTSWPAGFGVREVTAGPIEFDRRVVEVAAHHTLLNGELYTDRLETSRGIATLLFSESFPQSVEVWTAPGIIAGIDWLLVL